MKKVLEIINAGFAYEKDIPIWQNINLTLDKGQCLCLLGANGCGKTTLFNCINGNLNLNSGTILINGKKVISYSAQELAKTMGVVYQDHTVSFPYSSLEVVTMGRTPYLSAFRGPSNQDTDLAYAIMEEMGIADLADKKYSQISGGQRQLVLIARTLCQQPEIILFDEPTSHLDFKNQALVIETVKRLSQKGYSIIMNSHFPSHAWHVANQVALMGEQGIIASGSPEEIMTEEYLSRTYGVAVEIMKTNDATKKSFFCEPAQILEPSKL